MEHSIKVKDQHGHFILSKYNDDTIWFALYGVRSHIAFILTLDEAQELAGALQEYINEKATEA